MSGFLQGSTKKRTCWRATLVRLGLLATLLLLRTNRAAEAKEDAPVKHSAGAFAPSGYEAATLKREAVTIAREVAGIYTNDALSYALLGSAYYNTGESDEAAGQLKKAVELNPALMDAYEILAQVAYDKGNPDDAIRICEEALKHGPPTPNLLNRMGRALLDTGKAQEAIRRLEQAARVPGAPSESSYLLGQAYIQAGDFVRAKGAFLRAVELLPGHTQAYFGLYTACQRLGQAEEAGRYRETFQQLESADRKDLTDRSGQEDGLSGLAEVRETVARTFFGAGQVYLSHQEFARAAAFFRRSAALAPESPAYRSALERLYVRRNDPAEAIRVFTELVSEQPTNRWNYLFLGSVYVRLAQFEPAEKAFAKVQQLAPRSPEGYRAMAELYLRAKRKTDKAPALAARAVELEPSDTNYYLLAAAHLKNQNRAQALDAIQKAIRINPGEKRYRQFREELQKTPAS